MSNNMRVLLVGAGEMGREYYKVLKSLDVDTTVVCRKKSTAERFEEITQHKAICGGLENIFERNINVFEYAIVAVDIEQLAKCTIQLIKNGVKYILVEKPAGLNKEEIMSLSKTAQMYDSNIYVAYNRRFLASTNEALKYIAEDGGVDSFNFEFTEWGNVVKNSANSDEIKEKWMIANSTHVIDLAFFFGGYPIQMSSYCCGKLSWHRSASKYAGAGITETGALFSYNANWDAPGRWGVEILTHKHRLIFRPIERLYIQDINSTNIYEANIDYEIDIQYKPGLYKQISAFLYNRDDNRLLTIKGQLRNFDIYNEIEKIRK